jgi:hypothetical protein
LQIVADDAGSKHTDELCFRGFRGVSTVANERRASGDEQAACRVTASAFFRLQRVYLERARIAFRSSAQSVAAPVSRNPRRRLLS